METTQDLIPVIKIDEDKCINCHSCITACPVKYCNDGSGDHVKINSNMCIGCGSCLTACTHEARSYIDDFDAFLNDLNRNEKIVAIVAPSIAASFSDTYMNLNGWLKNIGISAIFDVSFGAELTIKSYLEHITENNPAIVIAQPCAAIVTYLELYQPELLKHLAPVHSPMLHTIRLIKEFYPEYSDHLVAVISPCNAKKREFTETGLGDYNVAYKSINNYLVTNKINLSDFPKTEFDNPSAERAVLFSTPGGLMQTAERWIPEIRQQTRKIEGVHSIYEYLKKLPPILLTGKHPKLVDCLSCEKGCNAGHFTLAKEKSIEEIEYFVEQRNLEVKKKYLQQNNQNQNLTKEKLEEIVNKFWKKNLYKRNYVNRWKNVDIKYPTEEQLKNIYRSMHKYSEKDIYNCSACGYGVCEKMAIAIFNNLNKPENCHFYLAKDSEISHVEIFKGKKQLSNILESTQEGYLQINKSQVIIDCNPAFKKMLKKNDLIGKSLFDFLDNENTAVLKEQTRIRILNKQTVYEIAFTNSEGDKVFCLVNGTPLYDDDKIFIGSFAMISDISELMKAQIELKAYSKDLEKRVKERTQELENSYTEIHGQKEEIIAQNEELQQQHEELIVIQENLKSNNEFLELKNSEINRQKNELIKKSKELDIANKELHGINIELDTLYKASKEIEIELQYKNDQINDSINYATRIQTSILPDISTLKTLFSDNFVLFKPKDKVSGDFYWWANIESHTVVTVSDCTGHGVPGAFMSMLGVSFLREIVLREFITTPGVILRKLRKEIIQVLKQKGTFGEQKDGMDMALISINQETLEMEYAGANNPCWIIRSKTLPEVEVLHPDKMPIGIYEDMKPFTTKTLQLFKNDQIYLTTDGYADQFGGKDNKKLKMANLKELLLQNTKESMTKQKELLESKFEKWKGKNDQIDDVLILGIKL
ncbi:MAG: hypothetical protein A2046_11020 [Bacteroidetes bacterium GWA2_30_7]|nr:MAG: hypothetical protein A2046_11020 [Bacteroidetes bacterium GWA2_30_7]